MIKNTHDKKPVIGLVLKGYPRLSETFISQEILALENKGFRFEIISLRKPTDKAVHPVNREISAPVNYLPEYIHDDPIRVLKSWLKIRSMPGFKHAKHEFFKDLKRDFTRNRIRRFAQGMVIAAEFGERVAAYYVHFLHTPTSAARYASIITDQKFAISAHAKDIWTSPDWEIKEKLADCEWLATCTDGARQHLAKLADQPEKINLVYHGLDLSRFPTPKKPRSMRDGSDQNNPVHIVTVGRAVAKKGLDILIDALAMLPTELAWKWTHIGGGPLREALMEQAKGHGLSKQCHFLGSLDQRDVIAKYQESDLFVMPCRIDDTGDRDGLPNVIVEAQSQSLAVISTPISGIPELIVNGNNGVLIDPNNAETLANAMADLVSDPKLRNKMGKAGEKRVRSEFDHLSTIGDLAELLDELLALSKNQRKDLL